MAKKKKTIDPFENSGDQSSDIEGEINGAFDTFLSNSIKIDVEDKDELILSTGIDLLDAILGGGVATKFIQFVGQSGGGKSALVSKILASAQTKYGDDFIGIYADSEETMSVKRLEELGIKNIKPRTGITIEKLFRIIDGLCAFKEQKEMMHIPSIVIWDSIANTPTESSLGVLDPNSVMGQKARILSTILPNVVQKLNKYNICLLAVNQMRDDIQIGPVKSPSDLRYLMQGKKIPGGQAILYNSFQMIYVRHSGDVEEFGFKGAKIQLKTIKNKLFTPNIGIELILDFSNGFSNFWTNYVLLKEHKRVNAGAWCSLIDMPELKFRQSEVLNIYNSNKEFKNAFDAHVKDVLKTEYIEKYAAGLPAHQEESDDIEPDEKTILSNEFEQFISEDKETVQ